MISSVRRHTVIALLTIALAATPALAKEKNGLALGGEAGHTNTGLSVKYAIGNFHIQLMAGLDFFSPEGIDRIDYTVGATLRFTYALARMLEETNFVVGAGATFDIFNSVENDLTVDVAVTLELLIGVEHFFNDFFSVSGFVGIPIEVLNGRRATKIEDPDTGEITTEVRSGVGWSITGVAWGTGFHFYF